MTQQPPEPAEPRNGPDHARPLPEQPGRGMPGSSGIPAGHGDDAAAHQLTAPALRQPRWSGKKTAVAAALAIGISCAGAITASAAVPSGSTGGGGFGGRTGGGGFGTFRNFEGQPGSAQRNGAGTNPGGTNGNSSRNKSSGSGGVRGSGAPSVPPS